MNEKYKFQFDMYKKLNKLNKISSKAIYKREDFNEIDMFYIEEVNNNHVYKRKKKAGYFALSLVVATIGVLAILLFDIWFQGFISGVIS